MGALGGGDEGPASSAPVAAELGAAAGTLRLNADGIFQVRRRLDEGREGEGDAGVMGSEERGTRSKVARWRRVSRAATFKANFSRTLQV